MSTYQEAVKSATQRLEKAGIENSAIDAWYLFAEVTGMTKTEYFLNATKELEPELRKRYEEYVKQRLERIPMQYIIGEQEFMGLTFEVNENVLIPRQDTEILVELALQVSEDADVLDVCTGSGCIAISIAKLSSVRSMTALDISEAALLTATRNAKKNETDVMFIKSNMFEKITKKYDVIVSNPPYIPSKVVDTLMPEVKDHEPRLALDGTEDGLAFYRILAEQAKNHLNLGGKVFFEIGCEQAADVCTLLRENGYDKIQVTKDYAGLDRVVSAIKAT